MVTAETITDEQIRELREQEARWLDDNPASRIGESLRWDDWMNHSLAWKAARVALGELRPKRGGTKRAARARIAAYLTARAAKEGT